MGWPTGGPFWPHRTHENGLSADFMAPVDDGSGTPQLFPTTPWTRFGYDLEFDREGRVASYRINFEAIAQHLDALGKAAAVQKLTIERVIVAPEYASRLMATPTGRRLTSLPFMRGQAWVRHDEHYHVDFRLGGS
jgi:penicillin-insensitive murein DD-endopeptidase